MGPRVIKKGRVRPRSQTSGVALIMVLVITTILGGIAADLSNHSQVNLRASANARDELQAHFHARSAVELELFLLRLQTQVQSTIGQFLPVPLFELSGFLISSDTMKGILKRDLDQPVDRRPKSEDGEGSSFGNFAGSFWIDEVVDENRKINISSDGLGVGCSNLLHSLLGAIIGDPKYDPVFENLGETRDPLRNRIEVIGNITDWVDANETVDPVCILSGDESQSTIPEDTRYDRLPYNARYEPKNGLMSSLHELRLVPGVNDAFFRLFSPYLTVWSDNKGISLQTADANMLRAVLRSISPALQNTSDTERIERFLEERELLRAMPPPLNRFSQPVFQQLLDAVDFPYDKARLDQLLQSQALRFDDVSNVYRIRAVGRVNDASSTITLIWRNNRAQGDLYYWREE